MIDLNSFQAWSLTRTIEFLISCNTNTNHVNNVVIVFDDDLLKLLLVINNIFIKYNNNDDDGGVSSSDISSSSSSITIVIDDKCVNIVNNYISIITNHINEIGIVTTTNKIKVSSTIPCDANHVIFINPINKCWDNTKAITLYDTITTTSLHVIDTSITKTSKYYETTIKCIGSDMNVIITRSISDETHTKMITALALSLEAFKDSLVACIDYCHIFPALIPIPLRNNNSKLVFEGSSGHSNKTTTAPTAPMPTPIVVWTVPGPLSSLDYLISLLRASKYSVHIYSAMILLLKEKSLFVRNCAMSRQLEVVEALELVFFNGLARELSSMSTVPSTSSSTLIFAQVVSEISRFIVGIDSHNEKTINLKTRVLQIARSALLIHPMNVEINLVLARCLFMLGLSASSSPSYLLEAKEAYIRVLNIINDHAEAKAGLEEVAKALCNISNNDDDNNDNAATSFKKLNLWRKMAYMTQKKANIDSGYKLIENDITLSESIVWDMQRRFYYKKGLEAWNRGDEPKKDIVPFFITSNSKIAMEYSRIFYSAIVDLHINDKLKLTEPLYIIELGSGCCKFSLLFVRFLTLLLQNSDLKVTIIHVISDFTDVNFEDISNYSDIKPFLLPADYTSGEGTSRSNVFIDFAVFDGDKDSEIKLLRSKQTLSSTSATVNPIFTVANYIFDSLVMDAYKVVHNPASDTKTALNEGRLTIFLKETENKTSIDMDELTSMDIKRCNLLWSYNNKFNPDDSSPKMNHVLDMFSNSLSPGISFTIPVGGLMCLEKLKALTTTGILVTLLADKAYNRMQLLEEHEEDPAIAQHGSLSMMVNLVAAGAYMKVEVESSNNKSHRLIRNGFSKHTPQRNSPLDLALLVSGINTLPTCELSFEMGFCEVGINDVFVMRDHCEDVIISKRNDMNAQHEYDVDNTDANQIDIVTICCLGHMCCWDGDMIFQFGKAIQYYVKNFDIMDENRKRSIHYLKTALKLIELGIVDQFDVRTECKLGLKEILKSFEE